ncbi:uncharacterized protein LOC141850717 [Brevipalpus obovatus]|uniref:uncharacterized protein LOC141850717 n=1 Tax=Brevipalpus obovatus TaxID=246614 RepID=UPI003D9EC133
MSKFIGWLEGSFRSVKMVPLDSGLMANLNADKLFSENEAESLPMFIPLSSSLPIGKLTPAVAQQRIVMLSLSPEVRTKSKDIFDLLDWELWIRGGLFVLIALSIMGLLTSNGSLTGVWKTLKTKIWPTVKLILLQDFSSKIFDRSRVLTASVIFFIFFLAAFLNSMISTDLIIVEKPFVIDKLNDILDPRAAKFTPVWRRFGGVHEIFSKSHSPIKQRIWRKAENIGIEKCLIDNDLIQLLTMSVEYSDSPIVGFVYEVTANFLKIHSCGQLVLGREVQIGSEPIGEELLSFPYHLRNDSCKGRKKAALEAWAMTVLEADVFNEAFMKSVIMETLEVSGNFPEKLKCLFTDDPFEQKYWPAIGTPNISQLLSLFLVGTLLSFSLLLGENIWFRLTR